MPARWVHSILNLVCLGTEFSAIHKWKDKKWRELGEKHRKERHELYQDVKKLDEADYSLDEILSIASELVKKTTEDFGDWLRREKNLSEEKINKWQNVWAQYQFHDILDLVWDKKTSEERRILEATAQDIWLNPTDYENLIPDWAFDNYFQSKEYEIQREFVSSFDYSDVDEKGLQKAKLNFKKLNLGQ